MVVPDRVLWRLQERITLDGDCRISHYSAGSHGYAQIGWQESGMRVVTVAHRALWIAVRGPIPDGMTIDHTCKRKKCLNLGHMRILPNFENARRTSGRDWPLGQCVKGHPNSELVRYGGKWKCKVCNREWQRRWEAKRNLAPSILS